MVSAIVFFLKIPKRCLIFLICLLSMLKSKRIPPPSPSPLLPPSLICVRWVVSIGKYFMLLVKIYRVQHLICSLNLNRSIFSLSAREWSSRGLVTTWIRCFATVPMSRKKRFGCRHSTF